ncbi:hypothetical protein G3576_21375 [Roseomonas stagni]|uniref:Uncharacterized protein n=1 Tax=Falsiroseomonas algicola TaxID=2716930 RepID=A0A6M1LQA2_9PROT|nr:hypothetical protein [Falsiroseomonas algicola]NGM22581.1 hypothetical protein [Falsiroseomonas algicola]
MMQRRTPVGAGKVHTRDESDRREVRAVVRAEIHVLEAPGFLTSARAERDTAAIEADRNASAALLLFARSMGRSAARKRFGIGRGMSRPATIVWLGVLALMASFVILSTW